MLKKMMKVDTLLIVTAHTSGNTFELIFRYILNYLRDGSTYIPYTNKQLVDELYEEVKFFQIQELLMRLEEERNQKFACNQIDYIKLLELLNLSSKPLQAP